MPFFNTYPASMEEIKNNLADKSNLFNRPFNYEFMMPLSMLTTTANVDDKEQSLRQIASSLDGINRSLMQIAKAMENKNDG